MEEQKFIDSIPYLYHLTDRRNLDFIKGQKKLYSTVDIIAKTSISNKDQFLRTRRPEHSVVTIDGVDLFIRDQRPLNRALEKCLTDNWTVEDFIYHLNKRVFLWPNLHRLNIHYGRYQGENPIILRFTTDDIFELNNNAEISIINSGATRPSGALGGKAAARGKDTFRKLSNFDSTLSKVAEVTFPAFCNLPRNFYIGNAPDGPWEAINL